MNQKSGENKITKLISRYEKMLNNNTLSFLDTHEIKDIPDDENYSMILGSFFFKNRKIYELLYKDIKNNNLKELHIDYMINAATKRGLVAVIDPVVTEEKEVKSGEVKDKKITSSTSSRYNKLLKKIGPIKIFIPLFFNSKADSPIMIFGFLEESNFFENSPSFLNIFLISSV